MPDTLTSDPAPLVSVEGTAYDCGREYAAIVRERWPDYRIYLDMALEWTSLSGKVKKLFDARAPHLLDLYRGYCDDAGPGAGTAPPAHEPSLCTSFGVSGRATLDARPLSGQTKDTAAESADLYIVLRIRMKDAPTILVLAYPGEILGYGMWSTGMTIFRNSLHSSAGAEHGLSMVQWGLLALAGSTVDEAVDLAHAQGIAESGNVLLSDNAGKSAAVEFNAGGVSVLHAENGINVHANHPVGPETIPFGKPTGDTWHEDSLGRMARLADRLHAERGRLTAHKALHCLADHDRFPWGICNHAPADRTPYTLTTAAVIADPQAGQLHVVRGSPCANWPVTYCVNGTGGT